MTDVDVLVVGAGAAGALAAARLAGLGRHVLLVDRARFPRDKVCGGCLQPGALAAMEAAGLGRVVPAPPAGAVPLRAMALHAGGRVARVRLRGGVAISRRALDLALVEAAVARGAAFREGVRARLGQVERDARVVLLEDGEEVRAGIVLDASGLAGGLAGAAPPRRGSLLGAGTTAKGVDLEPGVVRMACARGGYVGTVRVEEGRCVVAAALAPKLVARAGGLEAAASSILAACGLPPPPPGDPWRGTPPLTRRPARVWQERVLAVGDAAGYVEPFTGEGMTWAMRAAIAAAEIAARGWTAGTGPLWQRAHRRIVGARQRRCRMVAVLLRAPALVRLAVRALGVAPALAAPLVRGAAGEGVA
ncbi:MAG TPA: FAD-dependent monooxygenase [Planctomycetota bacterium]|nr:FAD-dependent monooxygenase [Planctomycetota bacterium]